MFSSFVRPCSREGLREVPWLTLAPFRFHFLYLFGSILGALHISISFYANIEIRKMFLDTMIKVCSLHPKKYMRHHRQNIPKTSLQHHRVIIGKYLEKFQGSLSWTSICGKICWNTHLQNLSWGSSPRNKHGISC